MTLEAIIEEIQRLNPDDRKKLREVLNAEETKEGANGTKENLGKRVPNLNRGAARMSSDFDEPLPDEFWLGEE